MDGKSWGLLGILREHRGAVEYDFRSRFGCGLTIIGRDMSLPEAARLVAIIRADPSSALAASIEGWDHPVSREAAVLMDLWDLEAAKTGAKKPPKYPRVWKTNDAQKLGDIAGRDRGQVLAMLGRSDLPA